MQGGSPALPSAATDEGILARIVRTKREEVRALKGREEELRARAEEAPPPRDFRGALVHPDRVALIAEVKRRSPGAGAIRPELDPPGLAGGYAGAGASAISVLTDRDYFGGSLEDLSAVRARVPVPVLRKDFTVDPLQVVEARGAGADAILLIVRILEDRELRELRELAEALGMSALVEAHDADEVERALASGAGILGVNNRDLRTFTTRLETTLERIPGVPPEVVFVSESGIRTRADVEQLGGAGVDAVLVGESLLRAPDPAEAAGALVGVPKHPRTLEDPVGRERG